MAVRASGCTGIGASERLDPIEFIIDISGDEVPDRMIGFPPNVPNAFFDVTVAVGSVAGACVTYLSPMFSSRFVSSSNMEFLRTLFSSSGVSGTAISGTACRKLFM